jgi:hypothetical protein
MVIGSCGPFFLRLFHTQSHVLAVLQNKFCHCSFFPFGLRTIETIYVSHLLGSFYSFLCLYKRNYGFLLLAIHSLFLLTSFC